LTTAPIIMARGVTRRFGGLVALDGIDLIVSAVPDERLVAERTEELRAREADLHAQNMRFNAAISNMSQGLVMFDSHSRLVICNSRYAEMYRLRPDEVRPGLTLRQLLERRAAEVDADRPATVRPEVGYAWRRLRETRGGVGVAEAQ